MTVYLVSYDLNKPEQDYEGLLKELRSFSGYYHILKSAWLVSTQLAVKSVYDKLASYLDKNDHILITRIDSDYYGWMPEAVWNWLKN